MPLSKSAKKELKKNLKRRLRNLRYKNKIKALQKEFKVLISKNKLEEAKKLLARLYKAIDKASKVGVIKKNKASRKKSQFAQMLNQALNVSQK